MPDRQRGFETFPAPARSKSGSTDARKVKSPYEFGGVPLKRIHDSDDARGFVLNEASKTGKRSISNCGSGEYQCDNGECIAK
ncbi:hypothetical protein TELCIR_25210, partial [Teladorsagia circumcincta]